MENIKSPTERKIERMNKTVEKKHKEKLKQCPYCKATKCLMNEPCPGCETYAAKWRDVV
ncbi:MAG: hypothetical protein GY710_06300 [Desulfobacteraceae bacterium]|nr:hypothetical protein [Desulfobacteraceae bacterium]